MALFINSCIFMPYYFIEFKNPFDSCNIKYIFYRYKLIYNQVVT